MTVFTQDLSATQATSATALKQQSKTIPINDYGSMILRDTPLAYYRFDNLSGTTQDSSPNGRNGGFVNGASLGQPSLIAGGFAVEFNGSNQFYAVSSFPQLTVNFTLEAWVKVKNLTQHAQVIARDRTAATGFPAFWMKAVDPGAGGATVFIITDAGGATTILVGPVLSINTPYHMVVTSQSGSMKMYIDGALVASNSGVTSIATQTGSLTVGAGWFNGVVVDFVNGSVDEAAVYSSTLTATQVYEHYLAGKSKGTPAATTMFNSVGKPALLTQATTASVLKRVSTLVSAVQSLLATLDRTALIGNQTFQQTVVAAQSAAASLLKQVSKLQTASSTPTATLVTSFVRSLTLLVTQALSTTLTRRVNQSLQAAQTFSISLPRVIATTRTLAQSIGTTLTRRAQALKSTTQGSTVVFTASRAFLLTLAASVANTVTMIRRVSAFRTAPIVMSVTLPRVIRTTIAAVSNALAFMTKMRPVTLAASVSSTASVISARIFIVTLVTVVTLTITLRILMLMTQSVVVSATARLQRSMARLIQAVQGSVGFFEALFQNSGLNVSKLRGAVVTATPALTSLRAINILGVGMDVLYVDNDNVLEVQNLRNANRNEWITAATVEITLRDADAVEVAGAVWPMPMTYIPDSKGVYRVILPASLVLTAGKSYRADITANAGAGLTGRWHKLLKAVTRII